MYKQVYYFQFIEIIKKNNFDQSKSRKNPEYYIAIKYLLLLLLLLSFKLTSLWLS